VLGTAAYVAPEQAAGHQVTPAADVYSLGVVLYEALTGRTPWLAATISELLVARRDARPSLPGELAAGIPEPLESLVLRCLADDPAARPSAEDVERTLRGELDAPIRILARTSEQPTALMPPIGRSRRRTALVLAAVLAVLGTVLGFGLAGGSDSGKPAEPRRPAVAGVAPAQTPAAEARNLSRWLRSHSR
jgi:serine/threonine-protein kinase